MKQMLEIRGVICPMVTPFAADSSIDLAAIPPLVDFLLAGGVHGLMAAGTIGEGMLLSAEERISLLEAVLRAADARCPVIAHTGSITTAETVRLTRHARAAGATAASIITPYFFPLDDEAILAHYVTCANAAPDLPIFIYALPSHARNDVSPQLLKRIRQEAGNIVGMKYSNPSLIAMQELMEAGGEGFTFVGGVDGLMLPMLLMGGHGEVSGNSNAFPEVFRSLYDAFLAGDLQKARSLQRLVNALRELLKDGRYPAYYKAVLTKQGVPAGRVRGPMRELGSQEMFSLEQGIKELGLS